MAASKHSLFLSFAFLCHFLFLPALSSAEPKVHRQLRYVQAIWRHGDRAPRKKPYESDIYDESYWPRGWNQLTLEGMRQMHELGEFLRQRYVVTSSFLSSEFNRKEVFIRSSAVNRALESAQVLLNGLFPPTASSRFDTSLNWQPIPVHSVAADQPDPLLRPGSFECPRYEKLKTRAREELEDQLWPKYKDLAEDLRPVLRVPDDQPVKFRAVTKLRSIQIEVLHNLTQPDWVHKRWPQFGDKSTLDLVAELRDKEQVAGFNANEQLARLSGGHLLGDWLRRVQQVAGNGSERMSPRKMVLYSSHDDTLAGLLAAMQVKIQLSMPTFASCVIMEIYEQNGVFHIELFYRRNEVLEQLVLSGCAKNCPLENFTALVEKTAILEADNLYEECGAQRCVMLGSHSPAIKTFQMWTAVIVICHFSFVYHSL